MKITRKEDKKNHTIKHLAPFYYIHNLRKQVEEEKLNNIIPKRYGIKKTSYYLNSEEVVDQKKKDRLSLVYFDTKRELILTPDEEKTLRAKLINGITLDKNNKLIVTRQRAILLSPIFADSPHRQPEKVSAHKSKYNIEFVKGRYVIKYDDVNGRGVITQQTYNNNFKNMRNGSQSSTSMVHKKLNSLSIPIIPKNLPEEKKSPILTSDLSYRADNNELEKLADVYAGYIPLLSEDIPPVPPIISSILRK